MDKQRSENIFGRIIVAGVAAYFMVKYNYEISQAIIGGAEYLWELRGSMMTYLERTFADAGIIKAFFLLIVLILALLITAVLGAGIVWVIVKLNDLYVLPFIAPLLVVYSKFSYAFIVRPVLWVPQKLWMLLVAAGKLMGRLMNLFVVLPLAEIIWPRKNPTRRRYNTVLSLLFVFGSLCLIVGVVGVAVSFVRGESVFQSVDEHLSKWFGPNREAHSMEEFHHRVVIDGSTPFWTETGINLMKWDVVSFEATGVVRGKSPFKTGYYRGGPNGFIDNLSPAGFISPNRLPRDYCTKGHSPSNYVLDDKAINGLMGKVGTGEAFFIGSVAELKIRQDGELLLGLNHVWRTRSWEGNSGSFDVNIVIRRK